MNTFIFYLSNLLFLLPCVMLGQVGDHGNFYVPNNVPSSIELNIIGNSPVSWHIHTFQKYQTGFNPDQRIIEFSVSANIKFRVDFSNTRFQNSQTDILDIKNIGFRVEPSDSEVSARYLQKFKWGKKDGGSESANLSGIYLGSLTSKNILLPGSTSNAGPHNENSFYLRVGLASQDIRDISGLPTLFEQNIIAGYYSSVITLLAYPDP